MSRTQRPDDGGRDLLTDLFRNPLDPGYASAARRAGPRTSWRRRTGRSITLVTLVVVGLLLAVAYRQVVHDEPARAQVRAELVDQIQKQDSTTAALEQRADDLRDEVARLRDRELAGPQARALRDLEASTGLVRVSGDGVVVQVADGTEQDDPLTGSPVLEARILDYDLQRIANALWSAGAEAVAINDRRLTATSTIRSASGAILVNRLPVASPYEVVAVGPDDLAQRFTESPTGRYLHDLVGVYGIDYEVRQQNGLSLPAAVAPDLLHAAPPGATPSPTGGD